MREVDIVRKYYDEDPAVEWERLERHYFEFEITKHYLRKFLSGKRILDIGGGPGRYAIWLAQEGFDVTLLDLSDANISFAKEKAVEKGVSIRALQADARDLSLLGNEVFDHVLLMGPLYHLFEEKDRIRCVSEASSRLRTRGFLFATFITLHAGLNYYLSECPDEILQELTFAPEYLDCLAEGRSWSGTAFTEAVFMHPAEKRLSGPRKPRAKVRLQKTGSVFTGRRHRRGRAGNHERKHRCERALHEAFSLAL